MDAVEIDEKLRGALSVVYESEPYLKIEECEVVVEGAAEVAKELCESDLPIETTRQLMMLHQTLSWTFRQLTDVMALMEESKFFEAHGRWYADQRREYLDALDREGGAYASEREPDDAAEDVDAEGR